MDWMERSHFHPQQAGQFIKDLKYTALFVIDMNSKFTFVVFSKGPINSRSKVDLFMQVPGVLSGMVRYFLLFYLYVSILIIIIFFEAESARMLPGGV